MFGMEDEFLDHCRQPFLDNKVSFQEDEGGVVRFELPDQVQND